MRTIALLFLSLFANLSYAEHYGDFASPEWSPVSNKFPQYDTFRTLSFEDTGGKLSSFSVKFNRSNREWDKTFTLRAGYITDKNKAFVLGVPVKCFHDTYTARMMYTVSYDNTIVMFMGRCNGETVEYVSISQDLLTIMESNNILFLQEINPLNGKFIDSAMIFETKGVRAAWNRLP
jgi:hypothetical protein